MISLDEKCPLCGGRNWVADNHWPADPDAPCGLTPYCSMTQGHLGRCLSDAEVAEIMLRNP